MPLFVFKRAFAPSWSKLYFPMVVLGSIVFSMFYFFFGKVSDHKRTIAVYMRDSKVVYMISQMLPELVSIRKHQTVEKL